MWARILAKLVSKQEAIGALDEAISIRLVVILIDQVLWSIIVSFIICSVTLILILISLILI
jgi:hypothetical protein